MPVAIECRGLFKTYRGRPPVEAVRGIDLQVNSGECFGVLGPNGAGKTTTIEILEGLLEPTSGEVEIFGLHWHNRADQIRQQIGVSLQESQLSDRLSVRETLTLFRSFYREGLDPAEALRQVSLEDKAGAWIKKLSGGQKQRLSVACALVGNPRLLFLDEPTTGLDPSSRRELWDIIRSFRAEGRTILLTTHYMEEAERLCDRVAIVDRGRVIALGTPAELIASLRSDHVVEFNLSNDEPAGLVAALAAIPGVVQLSRQDARIHIQVEQLHRVLPRILATLTDQQIEIHDLSTRQASLEDVFVKITGRQFEEAEEPK
jgi:ABC-2 type transport system ATP-binding protein